MMKRNGWIMLSATLLVYTVVAAFPAQGQAFKTFASFDDANGAGPRAPLIQGVDGDLYGTTTFGGNANCDMGCGTVFKITRRGNLTTIYTFCSQQNCPDGEYPYAGLALGADGNLYGTTTSGGNANCNMGCGTIFKITPRGNLATIYSFCSQENCPDGEYPYAGLILGADGNFYGATYSGGNTNCEEAPYGCGTVFKITAGGVLTTLTSFTEQPGPLNPYTSPIQGMDGNLYGTSPNGGKYAYDECIYGCGTIFEMSPKGTVTVVFNFCPNYHCPSGGEPQAGLIEATDGNFYGTTPYGGPNGGNTNRGGTVFKITPQGKLTTLYGFCAQPKCADGASSEGPLVQGTDGNFYGTTYAGGINGYGTIFEITPSGTLTTLYNFCGQSGCTDGGDPNAGLIQATDGKFYGTTYNGGDNVCTPNGCGTVFRLDIGLGPFVAFIRPFGKVGQTGGILGQGFIGTSAVSVNGTPAPFTVKSATLIEAIIPPGATTGYVTVTTPTGVLTSNVPFHVIP